MNFSSVMFIAFGLSMDAFAVSVTNGMMLEHIRKRDALKIGLFFGIAQGVMPLIGWLAGIKFSSYIEKVDHWIALILLSIIGINMIWACIKERREEEYLDLFDDCDTVGECEIDNKVLFLMAIATSIDALAVGVNFAFLGMSILAPIIAIGITTTIICFAGVFIGEKCGIGIKSYAELIGGIILIIIGINIFLEHTIW
ncbi:MAG: manganese efflux pump [Clostridiales bacterium]|nr:manganese efflux pump [Clostridiales bacterium]